MLYIVATPIGNLDDVSARAVQVLKAVDAIAAEDTRHSKSLLNHLGVNTRLFAFHEHNEQQAWSGVIRRLQQGESIALISDAGTPLISDPGYRLVQEAHKAGIKVVPIPGASALITALSVSGLATDRFSFEGFLPSKRGMRRNVLEALVNEPRTLIFYESPHRIMESVETMAEVFGSDRPSAVIRELTKTFETILHGTLGEIIELMLSDSNQQRGEFVVVIEGADLTDRDEQQAEGERVATILAKELSVKQASALAAQITGVKKNYLYKFLTGRVGVTETGT
jgi:16S rRNA (cytidine1402-2'-O)-methyltransferase